MLELAARATLLRFSRGEWALGTHQGRLPQELSLAGISTMAQANPYLANRYRPAFNTEFAQPAAAAGSAFVSWADVVK